MGYFQFDKYYYAVGCFLYYSNGYTGIHNCRSCFRSFSVSSTYLLPPCYPRPTPHASVLFLIFFCPACVELFNCFIAWRRKELILGEGRNHSSVLNHTNRKLF
ncbi:hypothetical protein MEW_05003 [Candida albicans P60002]|nr:hypothetical protein MEW_05003 [Candida albicans P60002]